MPDNLNVADEINEDGTVQFESEIKRGFRFRNMNDISTGVTIFSEGNLIPIHDTSHGQISWGRGNVGIEMSAIDLMNEDSSGVSGYSFQSKPITSYTTAVVLDPAIKIMKKLVAVEKELSFLKIEHEKLKFEYHIEIQSIRRDQNLQKLFTIKSDPLFGNHPEYSAIPEKVFSLAQQLILHVDLKQQPELFPSGEGSIQFEFGKSPTDYLEIEIFDEKIEYYSEINSEESEGELLNIEDTIRKINGI